MRATTGPRSATQKPASRWSKRKRNGMALGAATLLASTGFLLAPSQTTHAQGLEGYTYFSDGSIALQYACNSNKTYFPPDFGTYIVSNIDCTGRIWLHQDRNGDGWALCINGGDYKSLGKPYNSAGNLLAESITAACPK